MFTCCTLCTINRLVVVYSLPLSQWFMKLNPSKLEKKTTKLSLLNSVCQMSICMYKLKNAKLYTCTCNNTFVCTRICTCMYNLSLSLSLSLSLFLSLTHTHTYAHIHTHIHTYNIHTYMYTHDHPSHTHTLTARGSRTPQGTFSSRRTLLMSQTPPKMILVNKPHPPSTPTQSSGPIYPSLMECQSPIEQILPSLSPSSKL